MIVKISIFLLCIAFTFGAPLSESTDDDDFFNDADLSPPSTEKPDTPKIDTYIQKIPRKGHIKDGEELEKCLKEEPEEGLPHLVKEDIEDVAEVLIAHTKDKPEHEHKFKDIPEAVQVDIEEKIIPVKEESQELSTEKATEAVTTTESVKAASSEIPVVAVVTPEVSKEAVKEVTEVATEISVETKKEEVKVTESPKEPEASKETEAPKESASKETETPKKTETPKASETPKESETPVELKTVKEPESPKEEPEAKKEEAEKPKESETKPEEDTATPPRKLESTVESTNPDVRRKREAAETKKERPLKVNRPKLKTAALEKKKEPALPKPEPIPIAIHEVAGFDKIKKKTKRDTEAAATPIKQYKGFVRPKPVSEVLKHHAIKPAKKAEEEVVADEAEYVDEEEQSLPIQARKEPEVEKPKKLFGAARQSKAL